MPAIAAIRAKHMPANTAHDLVRGHGRGHGPLLQGVGGVVVGCRSWPCQRCGHHMTAVWA